MSNLLIGLAVNDIEYLKRLGKIYRLVKQASYVVAHERLLAFTYNRSLFPHGLRQLLSLKSSIKSVVTVWPNKKEKKGEYYYAIKASFHF